MNLTIYKKLKKKSQIKSNNKIFLSCKWKSFKTELSTLNPTFWLLYQALAYFIPHFKKTKENIFKAAEFHKISRKYCISRTIFKPFHCVKCQLVLSFKRGLFQACFDLRSFNLKVTGDQYNPFDYTDYTYIVQGYYCFYKTKLLTGLF